MIQLVTENRSTVNFKFNWGWGIAIFIGIFVISMLTMVFSTLDHRWELVTEDYYEKDLAFDQKAEKMRNGNVFSRNLSITPIGMQELEIRYKGFPANVEGAIHFFRPSNAALDFQVPIQFAADFKQVVKSAKLKSGKWNVQFEWKDASGKEFFTEKTLVLP